MATNQLQKELNRTVVRYLSMIFLAFQIAMIKKGNVIIDAAIQIDKNRKRIQTGMGSFEKILSPSLHSGIFFV